MPSKENGLVKKISLLSLIVSILAGIISIISYIKPDEYIAKGNYNNSDNKTGRYVECVDGDTMKQCNAEYFSDKKGELNNFAAKNCSVGGINISRSKHKCGIPRSVDVENGHKCQIVAICQRN